MVLISERAVAAVAAVAAAIALGLYKKASENN